MRRFISIFVFVFIASSLLSQKVTFFSNAKTQFEVETPKGGEIHFHVKLGPVNIETKSYATGDYLLISNDLTKKVFGNGEPMLPQIFKLLDVPAEAVVNVKSVKFKKEVINLNDHFKGLKVLPATPSQRKDQDKILPIADENIYNKNAFVNNSLVETEIEGWLRAYRIGKLIIKPFNYNPQTNQLEVYTDIDIVIEFSGADYSKTQSIKERYSSIFYNFDNRIITTTRINQKELLQDLPIKLIIVYPDDLHTTLLDDYKEWKERQGFDVEMAPLSDVGSTVEDIKSWLQNYYNNSENPQDFILFIGDIDQMPVKMMSASGGTHASDLYYCEYTGDYLPEVYWGRISADNTTELDNALDKILKYEKLEFSNTDYLNRTLLVAGNDESFEDAHGNGHIYYAENVYLSEDYGFETTALYQDPPSGANYHQTIINVINQGASFANYTAHCSSNGWADPSFDIADVNSLEENGMYGVWIGNCCLSNKFDEDDAFSEVALRASNKGTVAYLGGSNSTYWDEDYWWAVGLTSNIYSEPTYDQTGRGLYDALFHTQANEVNDPSTWGITTAQMIYYGNMAVEESASSRKEYYWQIYQVMGDPTLVPYVGIPENIVLSVDPVIMGSNTVSINTSPYTYITVYMNGERIGTGITGSEGSVTITTDVSITSLSITLYAWGQNKVPTEQEVYVIGDVPIITSVLDVDSVYNDETGSMTFTYTNSGDDAVTNVYVAYEVLDPGLTLNTDTVHIGTMNAEQEESISVEYTTDRDIPDLSQIRIRQVIHEEYEGESYDLTSVYSIVVRSPKLEIVSLELDLADDEHSSVIDPGEIAALKVKVVNPGHKEISNLHLEPSATPADYVTFRPLQIDTNLGILDTVEFTFDIYTTCFTEGAEAEFVIDALADDYLSAQDSIINHFGPLDSIIYAFGDQQIEKYPFYNWWENEETQILFKQEEIQTLPDTIDRIAFYLDEVTSGGYTFKNLKIGLYQGPELESFTFDSLLDSALFDIKYYAETINLPSESGWLTFNFNGDYVLDKTKDLMIYVFWGDNGAYTSYHYSTVGEYMGFTNVIYMYYDSFSSWGYGNPDTSTVRPAISIGGILSPVSGDCEEPDIPAALENTNIHSFKIYPNPASNIVNLVLPTEVQVKSVQILALSGRVLMNFNSMNRTLDVSSLRPGMYILRLETSNGIYITKLIKQ